MTQENKELLLKDLCARLPYKVKIQCINSDNETVIEELFTIGIEEDTFDCNMIEYVSVKPYLFPMSSMTEEQKQEYQYITERWMYDSSYSIGDSIDWLNKNKFDYRGLIPMGLALDATGLNIY